MVKKAFFLGCLVPLKYPQIEAAVRLTMPALGVELVDLPGFSCCPDPVFFKSVDQMAWLTLAARNLAVAEAAGLDIATVCSGCTATLAEAAHMLQEDAGLREQVNGRLVAVKRSFSGTGVPPVKNHGQDAHATGSVPPVKNHGQDAHATGSGKTHARHLASILRDEVGFDKIRAAVKVQLEGLKAAIHYGCHLLKPSAVAKVDDPDFPELQESLVAALGAQVAPHSARLHCCGKGCPDRAVSSAMAGDIVLRARESGADLICLVCPSCLDSFELVQVMAKTKKEEAIPVVSYFQLLGLAMGFRQEQLGFQYHRVPVAPALAKVLQ